MQAFSILFAILALTLGYLTKNFGLSSLWYFLAVICTVVLGGISFIGIYWLEG